MRRRSRPAAVVGVSRSLRFARDDMASRNGATPIRDRVGDSDFSSLRGAKRRSSLDVAILSAPCYSVGESEADRRLQRPQWSASCDGKVGGAHPATRAARRTHRDSDEEREASGHSDNGDTRARYPGALWPLVKAFAATGPRAPWRGFSEGASSGVGRQRPSRAPGEKRAFLLRRPHVASGPRGGALRTRSERRPATSERPTTPVGAPHAPARRDEPRHASALHERFEEVDRHREDDRRVLLRRDLRQRLQVAQLQRRRVLARSPPPPSPAAPRPGTRPRRG